MSTEKSRASTRKSVRQIDITKSFLPDRIGAVSNKSKKALNEHHIENHSAEYADKSVAFPDVEQSNEHNG